MRDDGEENDKKRIDVLEGGKRCLYCEERTGGLSFNQ